MVLLGNGVILTVVMDGSHTFGFELDDFKKLVGITQQDSVSGQGEDQEQLTVDPLRLLCDCVSLPPPLDLRHALQATSAALRRHCTLQQHLRRRDVQKLCLLKTNRGDPTRVEASFSSGITAALRVHDLYPDVR